MGDVSSSVFSRPGVYLKIRHVITCFVGNEPILRIFE